MNRFKQGFKNGITIGLGYFAVAFSLGIVASQAGLSALQGFLTSLLINASAGENAGFTAIKDQISYLSLFLLTIVTNARYILMSFALSQKIPPDTKLIHRLLLGFYLTDEFFALAISEKDYCDPFYIYGAISFAAPCWALGTALGIIIGNSLSAQITIALSVALYGMFLAIIIPPAKNNKFLSLVILFSFILSYLFNELTSLSSSSIIILLTILISLIAAIIKPIKENYHES